MLSALAILAYRGRFSSHYYNPVDIGGLYWHFVDIAFAKAVLIALFFMHVKYKNTLVLVFVCAGLFWLGIMFALSLGDHMTRSWLPRPSA